MRTSINDQQGIDIVIDAAFSELGKQFRKNPGRVMMGSDQVQAYIIFKLLETFGLEPEIQQATSGFVENLMKSPTKDGFYDISNLQALKKRAEQLAQDYWREIKCLI